MDELDKKQETDGSPQPQVPPIEPQPPEECIEPAPGEIEETIISAVPERPRRARAVESPDDVADDVAYESIIIEEAMEPDGSEPLPGDVPMDGPIESASAQTLAGEAQAPKKSIGREILEWVLVVVVAVVAALLIRTFIFEPVRVDGNSMLNTLHNNEYMIVTKYQYLFNDPQRFDVVICHYPGRGSTNFVKRIVGVPGDTVAVRDQTLYVNGEAVDEPYIDNKPNYTMPETVIEEGHYFVLGDNRSASNDSHVAEVGQLTRSQIVGKVRLVAWPISEWRVIH